MRSPRGVTLLEMMVVVAILAIMAAIAAPQLLPTVKKARLAGEAEGVAGFLEGIRQRAMSDGRCYRVTVPSATSILAEERNSGDCVNLSKDGWISKVTLRAEAGTTYRLSAFLDVVQPDPDGSDPAAALMIFRPNGRLRGSDDINTTNDKARIVVSQSTLTETRSVVVMETGRTCVIYSKTSAPTPFSASNAGTDCNVFIQ